MSATNGEQEALVRSILAPLSNKIKLCLEYPLKNMDLAADADFKNFVSALCEQMLPQWCRKNLGDRKAINNMHNLIYLLALKTHQVFQSRVIHQIID